MWEIILIISIKLVFSNDKTKSLFTPWKLLSIKQSKYGFSTCTDTFDWYLFQLIVFQKPDFTCCNTFALSWVDKVTNETLSLVSVIANVVAFVSLENTYFSDQVKTRLKWQLIKAIPRVLEELLKYFNDTNFYFLNIFFTISISYL